VAALDSIRRAKHDVIGVRCRPSKLDIAQHMARYFVTASLKRVRS